MCRSIVLIIIFALTGCKHAQLVSSKASLSINQPIDAMNIIYDLPKLKSLSDADSALDRVEYERSMLKRDVIKVVPEIFTKNGIETEIVSINSSGKSWFDPIKSKVSFKKDPARPLLILASLPLTDCEGWVSHSGLNPRLMNTCITKFKVYAKLFDYKTSRYLWNGVIDIPNAEAFYNRNYESLAEEMANEVLKDLRKKNLAP